MSLSLRKKRVLQLTCDIQMIINTGLFMTRIENIWNNIPADCRNEDNMVIFKNNIKIMLRINVIEI